MTSIDCLRCNHGKKTINIRSAPNYHVAFLERELIFFNRFFFFQILNVMTKFVELIELPRIRLVSAAIRIESGSRFCGEIPLDTLGPYIPHS